MRTSCSARAHEVELRRESSFKKWSHDDNWTPLGQFSCPWRTPAGPWLMARLAWASFTAKPSKGTHGGYFCTYTRMGHYALLMDQCRAARWRRRWCGHGTCIKYALKFSKVVVLVDADGAVGACRDARLQGGFRRGAGWNVSKIEHLE